MDRHFDVTFGLVDRVNPGFGYQLRITKCETGETLLFTSVRPDTGEDLLTAAACLEVASWYIDETEQA